MTGVEVFLSALRLDDGQLLIVAADQAADQAIEQYGERWEIETMFSCFKERGFNLEDTHITHRQRIKRLLAVLAVAFCWAHRTGEWQHENVKPIKVKKHLRLEDIRLRNCLYTSLPALLLNFGEDSFTNSEKAYLLVNQGVNKIKQEMSRMSS